MKKIVSMMVLLFVFVWSCSIVFAASQTNQGTISQGNSVGKNQTSKAPQSEKIIKRGMRGDDVYMLQKLLADAGFYSDDIDGIFGGATQSALQEFQQFCGLTPNGIATDDTFRYLERSLGEPSRYSRTLVMKATAYTAQDSGNSSYTRGGHLVRKGLVAVDPMVIPLGTRLYIPGYGYAIADDTGGSIKGNVIDLAFESYSEAIQFGAQRVTVYILD